MITSRTGSMRVLAEVRHARNLAATAFWMIRREIASTERRLARLKIREKVLVAKLEK